MNVAEILLQQTKTRANEAVLISYQGKQTRLTYAELDHQSACVASLLQQQGIKAGDAVLIFVPVSIPLYVSLIACFRLGAIAMFIDPGMGKTYIDNCCRIFPPKAFIGSAKAHLLRITTRSLRNIPVKLHTDHWIPFSISFTRARMFNPLAHIAAGGSEPALLTFTSGSTGRPKAAMRTHDFLLAQHHEVVKTLNANIGERDLTTFPIFVLSNMAAGVCSLIPDGDLRKPGEIDPAPISEILQSEKPQRLCAPPALLERIANYFVLENRTLTAKTHIFTGGAPVFPHLIKKLADINPQGLITTVYGSTEAEPIAHQLWQEVEENDLHHMLNGEGLLVGKPVSNIKLRIVDFEWVKQQSHSDLATLDRHSCSQGQAGEILVTGSHVLKSYYLGKGDGETKRDISGEIWHRTEDAGYLDKDGRLWLLGRASARIEDEAGVLYPFAVECAALMVDGVNRAALMQHHGERVLICETNNKTSQDLSEVLHQQLSWAQLSRILFIKRMPVDPRHNSKILYPELRYWLDKENPA
ncbi:MAG: AMP-binding protein [Gammaproteobacteria bacterium]|nr:AMP-binding protein [Gammaproteobacteria bacterium]